MEQEECENCNIKSCRAKIHGLKWVRNIFYARIQASKEDCLCRDLRIAKGLSGQGNKYNISHLTISLEAIFSEMIWTKKGFIFRQGKCIYRNSMKTRPSAIFASIHTAECIAGCNHDDSLKEDYCVPFFKLKFLIPILRHIYYSLKPLDIYWEYDFVKKCIFVVFEKVLFLMGGNLSEFFQKICKIFSSGYYFLLHIFRWGTHLNMSLFSSAHPSVSLSRTISQELYIMWSYFWYIWVIWVSPEVFLIFLKFNFLGC